jgi:hypothetical protein
MVMGPIPLLQSYLEVRCKEHNLVGPLEGTRTEGAARCAVRAPQESRRYTKSKRCRRIPEIPFDPADAKLSFVSLYRQGQVCFSRLRRLAPWN